MKIEITLEGLLAAERFLRDHCEEYQDGTPDGFHLPFVRDLIAQALHVSGIAFQMPEDK